MTARSHCAVCGQEDCGQHDSVLSFTNFMDIATLVALAGLGGLIATVVALINA